MLFNRRSFLSGLTGVGFSLPLVRNWSSPQSTTRPNRPLVVTSKTNPAVREEITTLAWDIMRKGGGAMDAAEKATNLSEREGEGLDSLEVADWFAPATDRPTRPTVRCP